MSKTFRVLIGAGLALFYVARFTQVMVFGPRPELIWWALEGVRVLVVSMVALALLRVWNEAQHRIARVERQLEVLHDMAELERLEWQLEPSMIERDTIRAE